jgi:hypothetical protein
VRERRDKNIVPSRMIYLLDIFLLSFFVDIFQISFNKYKNITRLTYCNAVAAASLKLTNRTTRSLTGLPDVSYSHPAPISGSYSSGRSSYSSDHSRIKGSPHLAVGASESLSFAHTLVRPVEYTLIHTSSLVTISIKHLENIFIKTTYVRYLKC